MINFIICDDVKKYREMAEKVIDAYMMKNKVEYKTHLFEDYDNSFMKIVESKLSFKIYINVSSFPLPTVEIPLLL